MLSEAPATSFVEGQRRGQIDGAGKIAAGARRTQPEQRVQVVLCRYPEVKIGNRLVDEPLVTVTRYVVQSVDRPSSMRVPDSQP